MEASQWSQSAMPKPTILWLMTTTQKSLAATPSTWTQITSIADHPVDDPEVFILEVDLEYPEDLHNAHSSYPLALERMVVQKKWMSECQHNLRGVGVAPTEVEKLVPNLHNKEGYVLQL